MPDHGDYEVRRRPDDTRWFAQRVGASKATVARESLEDVVREAIEHGRNQGVNVKIILRPD